jgi:hypothetical protein
MIDPHAQLIVGVGANNQCSVSANESINAFALSNLGSKSSAIPIVQDAYTAFCMFAACLRLAEAGSAAWLLLIFRKPIFSVGEIAIDGFVLVVPKV